MSNKSGVASQVISPPSGGGALQGIGETFSPDLFTGTGNFTVPIAVLPGRNGFHLKLDLVYSTGNGNGPFGLGWALSIPQVTRKTSRGIPRYRDDSTDPHEHDTSFLIARTTGPDGFSEDFSAGPPPVQSPEYLPPAEGRWQVLLTDPGRFGDLGELQLFFVCVAGQS